MKQMAKIKALATELLSAIDACEMGGEEMADEKEAPEAAPEADDEGADMASKSLKMKLAKYKA